ncbi:hypothetical protein AVEN_38927-1 [Araneus ventricosus]|uniref:Uncharacterized protein n=1 Tax=Araneus ventricosus TaxID=182803 RepID=A0A4Y2UVS0_ARAVE|nr:hypothetical protein AVEN_38927-1 [Araneus ventricosus]
MSYFHRFHSRSHRDSSCQHNDSHFATSLLDESRWDKHRERYATIITDDRGNDSRLRSSMRDREQLLFAARVDIDVYDASRNIAGISEFTMLRRKQYKHRNGDD